MPAIAVGQKADSTFRPARGQPFITSTPTGHGESVCPPRQLSGRDALTTLAHQGSNRLDLPPGQQAQGETLSLNHVSTCVYLVVQCLAEIFNFFWIFFVSPFVKLTATFRFYLMPKMLQIN